MGNCQAIDAATLVVQHPCGKEDKLYWPVSASEIMKMNPGHYVALLITTTTFCPSNNQNQPKTVASNVDGNSNGSSSGSGNSNNNSVRVTRVKILRPTDTLLLGQVYRLITAQEVMKGLWARKQAKMKKSQSESAHAEQRPRMKEKLGSGFESVGRRSGPDKTSQVAKHERHRPMTTTAATTTATSTPSSSSTSNSATARPRTWQPSLQSISETGS